MFRSALVAFLTAILFASAPLCAADAPLTFQLKFDAAALDQPFTGRVFVMLTRNNPGDLPSSISWCRPEPVFAKDVTDWKPGDPLIIDKTALAYPTPLKDVAAGEWYVSAVMDRDFGGISFAQRPGNIYAKATSTHSTRRRPGPCRSRSTRSTKGGRSRDGHRQARGYRKPAAVEVPRPADAAAGRRRAAAVVSRRSPSGAIRSSTAFPASAAITSARAVGGRGRPRASRRSTSSSTRRAGSGTTSSPTRPTTARRRGAGQGTDPAHRKDVSRVTPRRAQVRDRRFVGRLEQPLAAGDLPGFLRRRLVASPRTRSTSATSSAST